MLYLMETRNRSKTFVPLKGGAATVHVRYSSQPKIVVWSKPTA